LASKVARDNKKGEYYKSVRITGDTVTRIKVYESWKVEMKLWGTTKRVQYERHLFYGNEIPKEDNHGFRPLKS